MLTLFEQLLILWTHEEKVTLISSTADSLPMGLAAARLIELVFLGKVAILEKGRLELIDAEPTEDAILDTVVLEIQKSEKKHKISYWLKDLSQDFKSLHKALTARLIEKGVISLEDKRPSWVVPQSESTETSASAKYEIKHKLRNAVMTSGELTLRDLALLNLVQACDQLDLLFLKDERKLAARRIRELTISAGLSEPTFQMVEEISSAVNSLVEED